MVNKKTLKELTLRVLCPDVVSGLKWFRVLIVTS